MTSLLRARAAFERFCLENIIVSEKINTGPGMMAFFVLQEQAKAAEKFLAESSRQFGLQLKTADLPAGRLFVQATGTLSESAMADLAADTAVCYNDFRAKLSEVLEPPIGEMNLRHPDSSLRRANAIGGQFPASMQDYFRPKPEKKKKPTKKDMNTKIEEALEGIATPDDIQPQEGLKSLFSALKQSGLAQGLKQNGVMWHVAEPGRHAVTFVKDKIPILQLTSVELGDAKKLGEVLSQLTSIAQGKAPQAAQLELDRVKEMAARANERKGALDDIAQQFAVPKPEEQQPVTVAQSQV